MHQLGNRAGAAVADVRNLVADRIEDRLDSFEGVPASADHHRERCIACAGNSATHRRIEQVHAFGLKRAV
jgi:hypothetical protein